MKKILVMFLMMIAAMFASPLFALDELPPTLKSEKFLNGADMFKKDALSQVSTTHADDVTYVKVDILHKDTLMYSWGEVDKNRKISEIDGYKPKIKSDRIDVAVVCHLRGEGGV